MQASLPLVVPLLCAASMVAQEPLTVAESSDWKQTSRYQDVRDFLERLRELPAGSRLSTESFGKSHEGRDMILVTVSGGSDEAGGAEKLRILINANIHAGEVEGKEAVQILLREFAQGDHTELIEHADIMFVPLYNADGNERIDRTNRVSQNGPDGGVGVRPNAQGFDLNRDFIKAESPECRALLSVFNQHDPHLFMDLHTTNGSHHGYHLTYAPALATNVDPALDAFLREVHLLEVTRAVEERHGYRTFHYGTPRGRGTRKWTTYSHQPRYGTNYYGLRNRLSVLSEAYSYADFETRVRATRAFVLENLRSAVRHRERILALCRAADRHVADPQMPLAFGYDTRLVDGVEREVLVGSVERVRMPGDIGTRLVANAEFRAEPMLVQSGFASRQHIALPAAWAVAELGDAARANLEAHGIALRRLAEPARLTVETFRPASGTKSRRTYQGHRQIRLTGSWEKTEVELPAGTWIVPARQKLGRLATQLLEPLSEDSLTTWNFFEQQTVIGEDGQEGSFPVLRLTSLDGLKLR